MHGSIRLDETGTMVSVLHLFAIGGGQSPKLIQHRIKTRHLTQQLVQRDWPMCVTIGEIWFQFVIQHNFNIVRKE